MLSGVPLLADPRGALYWPEQTLAVADLHLEKGSSFASRGQMLPPYDTATRWLACRPDRGLFARYVVSLGDSFHDGGGPTRLGDTDRDNLRRLQRGRDWIWITGNHDPDPAEDIGGVFQETLKIGALTFRHEPKGGSGEVSGHLHPVARIAHRGRAVSRRCFAADATRLVLPAFGAFTGGLNVRDAAFADLFGTLAFKALFARRGPDLFFHRKTVSAGLVARENHVSEPADQQRHQCGHGPVEKAIVPRGVGDILFKAGLDHVQGRVGASDQIPPVNSSTSIP